MSDDIVYSTDPEWKPQESNKKDQPVRSDKPVYIEREKKGRGGKTVTTITNLSGDLKSVLSDLRKLCGSGGTIKNRVIEIQGDQREKISNYLSQKGISSKMRGG